MDVAAHEFTQLSPKDIHLLPNCRLELEGIDELAELIKRDGLLNPILVTENGGDGHYNLLAGHRRLAAWKIAHPRQDIPAIIKPKLEFREHLVLNLSDNIHRDGVHDADKAQRIAELIHGQVGVGLVEDGQKFEPLDKKDLAKIFKYSQSHLNNLQRCHMQLIPKAKRAWRKYEGLTTEMLGIAGMDHEEQSDAVDVIVARKEAQAATGRTRGKKKKDDDSDAAGSYGKASAKELQTLLDELGQILESDPAPRGVDKAWLEGKILGIQFALGEYKAPFVKRRNYVG